MQVNFQMIVLYMLSQDVKEAYEDVCGFYDWEYLNAPPDKDDPTQWSKLIKNA